MSHKFLLVKIYIFDKKWGGPNTYFKKIKVMEHFTNWAIYLKVNANI